MLTRLSKRHEKKEQPSLPRTNLLKHNNVFLRANLLQNLWPDGYGHFAQMRLAQEQHESARLPLQDLCLALLARQVRKDVQQLFGMQECEMFRQTWVTWIFQLREHFLSKAFCSDQHAPNPADDLFQEPEIAIGSGDDALPSKADCSVNTTTIR